MSSHITVSSVPPRIRYVANGSTTSFEFSFVIFNNSDLKVYFGSTLQNSSTYTVTGAGSSSGGSVTFSNAPASQTIITLTRELTIERLTDFQEGGALRADSLNDEFDYQIACQQQIADNLNRSLVLPPYAADTNVDLTLPTPNAGKAILWNAAGTNLENSTVSINELEGTIRGYKDAAAASATSAAAQVTLAQAQVAAAAEQAATATAQASAAATQAGIATTQAGIAQAQAELAIQRVGEVAGGSSSKANTNLDNITAAGKRAISGLSMPAASGTMLDFGSDGTIYTAPSNGWFAVYVAGPDSTGVINLKNQGTPAGTLGGHSCIYETWGNARIYCPVKSGDTVRLTYLCNFTSHTIYFIPAEGV